jgi:hypothetical protein
MKANEYFRDAFKRGWDEELSKLPSESKKVIEGLEPHEMAMAMFIVLLNPLTWFKMAYAIVKGGIDGFREGMSKK